MITISELRGRIIKSTLVTDSFWALLGNFLGYSLSMAAGIIVARFLGKHAYGEYGIIRNLLLSIAMFSTFGLGYSATKYVAEYKTNNPEKISIILYYSRFITIIFSSIMALGLFLSANYIAKNVLNAPNLAFSLKIASGWIIFNAVTTVQIGVLSGFGEFKKMAQVNMMIGITTFISSFSFTYLFDLNGALIALLLTQVLNWFLNYRLIKRNISKNEIETKKDKKLFKTVLLFSLPVALQEAIYSLTAWLTSLLLIKYTTYGELGLYTAAMQWNAIILFIPGILRNVILSHLSEASNDKARFNKVMKITLLFTFIATGLPFLIVLLSSGIISNIYGSSFLGLQKIINIAIFTSIIASISNVYTQAYMSKGKNWIMLLIRFGRDGGILLLSYYILSESNGKFGATSLIYSTLIISSFFLFLTITIYKISIK